MGFPQFSITKIVFSYFNDAIVVFFSRLIRSGVLKFKMYSELIWDMLFIISWNDQVPCAKHNLINKEYRHRKCVKIYKIVQDVVSTNFQIFNIQYLKVKINPL